MLKNAKWVRPGKCEAAFIRKEFKTEKIENSQIYICGLGFFELYINGHKVSDDVLTPVRSDYEPRPEHWHKSTSHRIYYRSYDITKYLKRGNNAMVVLLGDGWYNQHERLAEGNINYNLPKLIYSLETGGETICSDGTEKWQESHIYFNNIYHGEKQDLRRLSEACKFSGYDDRHWNGVEILPDTKSLLLEQKCPPDRVARRVIPKLIKEENGRKLYDVGENITGWPVMRVFGKEGDVVTLRFGEVLYDDYTINFSTAGWPDQMQQEEYICSGENLLCHPHFTFHGFRFFEVFGDGYPECVEIIESSMALSADFACDNEVLNWFFDAYIRTQRCNMLLGVPTDCPTRERIAYTGDGQLCADAGMLVFDSRELYRKWIYDIVDSQEPTTGHVPHTAPSFGACGGGPGGWGCAIVTVPYFFYKHFGEKEIIREVYPSMEKYIGYMMSRSEDNIVVREEEIGGFLGDWCTPEKIQLPPEYVNTYYFAKSLICMKELAEETGLEFEYDELLESVKGAIKKHFYNEENKCFCNGIQGANLFAIDLGMGDEEMMAKAASHYDKTECFDTGIFGTYLAIKLLFEKGYEDVAVKLLVSEKKNTFGYMKNNGATTIWELWNADDVSLKWHSHNHPMFAACVNQLFYHLLGFNFMQGDTLAIKPKLVKALDFVKGSVKCERGELAAEYRRCGDKVMCVITVNSEEEVRFVCGNESRTLKNGENVFLLQE